MTNVVTPAQVISGSGTGVESASHVTCGMLIMLAGRCDVCVFSVTAAPALCILMQFNAGLSAACDATKADDEGRPWAMSQPQADCLGK